MKENSFQEFDNYDAEEIPQTEYLKPHVMAVSLDMLGITTIYDVRVVPIYLFRPVFGCDSSSGKNKKALNCLILEL